MSQTLAGYHALIAESSWSSIYAPRKNIQLSHHSCALSFNQC